VGNAFSALALLALDLAGSGTAVFGLRFADGGRIETMIPPWQVLTIGLGRDGEVAERKMTLEDNAAHAWSQLWQKNVMIMD